jgi:hypothetical protein
MCPYSFIPKVGWYGGIIGFSGMCIVLGGLHFLHGWIGCDCRGETQGWSRVDRIKL